MNITIYPVTIEAYNEEMKAAVFKVEAFDAGSASVTIQTVVDVESWDEIAPLIREALMSMKLEKS